MSKQVEQAQAGTFKNTPLQQGDLQGDCYTRQLCCRWDVEPLVLDASSTFLALSSLTAY